MGMNNHHATEIATRREIVASLRLRGQTQREIIVGLSKHVDPITKEPAPIVASLGTVNNDLKALLSEWRLNAAADIADLKGKQIAEIAEGKRRAWADNNLSALVQMWKLEADIFGTNAPAKIEVYDWRKDALEAGINPDSLADELFGKVKPKVLTDDTGDTES